MKKNAERILAEVAVDPADLAAAAAWALEIARLRQGEVDHSDCNGMVSDFDVCDHITADKAAGIEAEYERYSNFVVVFDGLKRLAEAKGVERGSFDSLSGNA